MTLLDFFHSVATSLAAFVLILAAFAAPFLLFMISDLATRCVLLVALRESGSPRKEDRS